MKVKRQIRYLFETLPEAGLLCSLLLAGLKVEVERRRTGLLDLATLDLLNHPGEEVVLHHRLGGGQGGGDVVCLHNE